MWVEVCWVSTATSECHSFRTAPRRACLIPKSTDPAMWVAAKPKCTCLNKDDKLGAVLERITSLLLIIQLHHAPSLPNLFKKGKDSDQEESSTGAEEETSFGSEYSEGKRVRREYYLKKENHHLASALVEAHALTSVHAPVSAFSLCLTPSGQQQQQQHRLWCLWERKCDGRTGAFPQLQLRHFLSGGHGGCRQEPQLWRPQEEAVSPVSLISYTAHSHLLGA